MDFTLYRALLQRCSELDTQRGRQRFVTLAGSFRRPSLVLTPYEQLLLDQFVRGNLTFDQVQAFHEKQPLFQKTAP